MFHGSKQTTKMLQISQQTRKMPRYIRVNQKCHGYRNKRDRKCTTDCSQQKNANNITASDIGVNNGNVPLVTVNKKNVPDITTNKGSAMDIKVKHKMFQIS